MHRHVLFPPLLHMPLLEKRIIKLRNGIIFVRRNLTDIPKAPPRDEVVEAGGGGISGGYWGPSKRSP